MKRGFRNSLVLLIVILTISACDVVENRAEAIPAGQSAVSIAQRRVSILTPVVGEPDAGGVTEEIQIGDDATPTVSATGVETVETQQGTLAITVTPTFTPTLSPTNAVDPQTDTSTQSPATATQQIQPTNTQIPPTATFTATVAVEPSLTPTATTEVPGDEGATSCSSGGNSAFESEVISLINQERANEGLPAYSNQSQLTSAARTHSDDMACNNFFSHTSPTTGSPFDRIAAAGYSFSTAGENIAAGYGSPAAVVEGWMNSDGHRANILSKNFTQIGIGYAYWAESDYGAYWTAVFASP